MKDYFLFFRIIIFIISIVIIFIFLLGGVAFAEKGEASAVLSDNGMIETWKTMAAVFAVSVSCLASSLALTKIGSAALGAMSEKPELGGRALVFLGMAEGLAIYGLIIAIMILNKM